MFADWDESEVREGSVIGDRMFRALKQHKKPRSRFLQETQQAGLKPVKMFDTSNLPREVDWRKKGAVQEPPLV